MKLLTYNLLNSNIGGIAKSLPFYIEVYKIKKKIIGIDKDFIANIMSRIDWRVFRLSAQILIDVELPDKYEENMLFEKPLLEKLHSLLLEMTIYEGFLVCPETGRKFMINRGIPNLILRENES